LLLLLLWQDPGLHTAAELLQRCCYMAKAQLLLLLVYNCSNLCPVAAFLQLLHQRIQLLLVAVQLLLLLLLRLLLCCRRLHWLLPDAAWRLLLLLALAAPGLRQPAILLLLQRRLLLLLHCHRCLNARLPERLAVICKGSWHSCYLRCYTCLQANGCTTAHTLLQLLFQTKANTCWRSSLEGKDCRQHT
jgi:hypothetical protein